MKASVEEWVATTGVPGKSDEGGECPGHLRDRMARRGVDGDGEVQSCLELEASATKTPVRLNTSGPFLAAEFLHTTAQPLIPARLYFLGGKFTWSRPDFLYFHENFTDDLARRGIFKT